MVLLSSTVRGRVLRFHNGGVDAGAMQVMTCQGTEAISRLYQFDIELVSDRRDLDPAILLQNPSFVAIKQGIVLPESRRGIRTLRIHGILSMFEQAESRDRWIIYRATLVPRMWRLSQLTHSRIFLQKTAPEIVQEVLRGAGLSPQDIELRLGSREYARRDYVVQYQETDLAFVSRLMEHEGIAYYFLQADDAEKVVLADAIGAHEPILGDEAIPFRPRGSGSPAATTPGGEWFRAEEIGRIAYQHRALPREIRLRDYNHRTPGVEIQASAEVSPTGVGEVYEYGDHFRDAAEGAVLARMRAEELRSRERLFPGASDVKSFRAGYRFRMREHPRSDFNQPYLIVEVRHRMEQAFVLGNATPATGTYENEFVAMPADRVFRPARATPKPRVNGVINAVVDGGGSGEHSELDETGQYRVRFPLDTSGRAGGRATRSVRMMQPYGGANRGFHCPLPPGAEVAISCVNGDPDRPIIAGVVPNSRDGSPVSAGNNTQAMLVTPASFLRIEHGASPSLRFEDNNRHHINVGCSSSSIPAPDGIVMGTPNAVSINAGGGVNIAAGSPNHNEGIGNGNSTSSRVSAVIGAVAGVAAAAGGAAAGSASGAVSLIAGLVGAIGGSVAGIASSNAFMTAPGMVGLFAGGGATLGAIGSASVVGATGATLASPGPAAVTGVASASLASARNVDVISLLGNVSVTARARNVVVTARLGLVSVLAKRKVTITAQLQDVLLKADRRNIVVDAFRNVDLRARNGRFLALAKQFVRIESENQKRIQLKAGNSLITMTNNQITLKADTIQLQSNRSKGIVKISDRGPFALHAHSKNKVKVLADNAADVEARRQLNLKARTKIKMDTGELDQRSVRVIKRKYSKEE